MVDARTHDFSSEKKIDRIEDRLSGIERLLRQLALNPTNVQPKQDEPLSPDEERPLRGSPGRLISEMADTDGAYGGETTFNQDSVFASELLENAVNANILPTRGGEINAALSSLKNIVKQKSQIKTQDTRAPLKGGSNRNALRDSKLPPFDFTKAALDKMNGILFAFTTCATVSDRSYRRINAGFDSHL